MEQRWPGVDAKVWKYTEYMNTINNVMIMVIVLPNVWFKIQNVNL